MKQWWNEVLHRNRPVLLASAAVLMVVALASAPIVDRSASGWTIVGWNNLGMHCMDAEFSVFSILPPYNVVDAQVIDPSGNLVTNPAAAGVSVTYQAVADPRGSVNTTSQGKTDFWQHVAALFGVALPVDAGLAGKNMPGPGNAPQPMTYDSSLQWFEAAGIPITPYDDAGEKNYYPLMRLTAKNAAGQVLATTDVVLPVSDEMNCNACHASGSSPDARPSPDWVNNPDPEKDYRLNVLLLHDNRNASNPTYAAALAARGYSASGLYPTVVQDGKAILCAACHASEALPGTGYPGVPALTQAVHGLHASVQDPTNGMILDASDNRTACYRCHPGSATRCLRGVMGNAVAADGTMSIQCQNCHGPMSAVGSFARTGWLDEPSCQQCHTGNAVQNNGLIRYTSVFEAPGVPRVAVNQTFATNSNTPGPGLSLYRFSQGHGGVKCEACHGSTHAEFPASHDNDNIQSLQLQGHVGTLAECTACHASMPQTVSGGPHGMHPVGQSWIEGHKDPGDHNPAQCQACHGSDYRGTVLSRSFANRTLNTDFGTKNFWRGFQIGCYTCHNGPRSESRNPNRAPVVQNAAATTQAGDPVNIGLSASDADGNPLTLRVVNQPKNGTAGLSGTTATYFPYEGFSGTDIFTFAAWDGSTDSNLATVTVSVMGCALTCGVSVPGAGVAGQAVSFSGSATASGCAGQPSFQWAFGDGGSSSAQNPSHTYASAGTYAWSLTVTADGQGCTKSGTIVVNASQVQPPYISEIKKLDHPFRLRIEGGRFQGGAQVFIGADASPWPGTSVQSSSVILLSGAGLKYKFPKDVRVTVRVVNPDGGSVSGSFKR